MDQLTPGVGDHPLMCRYGVPKLPYSLNWGFATDAGLAECKRLVERGQAGGSVTPTLVLAEWGLRFASFQTVKSRRM
jgi:hypothetical protein